MSLRNSAGYPSLSTVTGNIQLPPHTLYPSLTAEVKKQRVEAGYTRTAYLLPSGPGHWQNNYVYVPQAVNLTVKPPTCPACRVGWLETEYSWLCICCALCCFPFSLGRHKRCNNCNAYF